MHTKQLIKSAFLIALIGSLSACGLTEAETAQTPAAAPAAPQVSVAQVISRQLNEASEFTGRLQAPQDVQLVPRVSGYIEDVVFEEGALVEEGQLLFRIDRRPFVAEVQRLEADLINARSELDLARKEYKRAKRLAERQAIAQEILDNRLAQQQGSVAQVQSITAALELAKLNLSYTEVTAPIRGRVSRAISTKGNYVTAGQTQLTSLVSTDKVYAYFDADENTYLNILQQSNGEHLNVMMGLVNDSDLPNRGRVDFIDNRIDPRTGTIRVRAVFDNQDGHFLPGLFAKVRLISNQRYAAILIDEKAIGTDLNNKYVLVIDDNNQVSYRAVQLGQKVAGLRVIKSGLEAGEQIVVNGLLRVRPGATVAPQNVDMASEQSLSQLQEEQALANEQLVDATESAVVGG